MFVKKFRISVSIGFFLSLTLNCAQSYEDYNSNMIVAVDFSNSYFHKERKPIIAANLKKLSKAITSKRSKLELPLLFQVIPIDSQSQGRGLVCEFTLKPRGLVKKDKSCTPDNNCSTKKRQLAEYITDICGKVIKERKEDNLTDIQGALSLANQLAESQTQGSKFLVIFSDMFEFRHKEIPVTAVKLTDFKVLVVCSGAINAEFDEANFCMGQQKTQWTQKFRTLGATEVLFVVETGSWSTKGLEFFKP